MQFLDLIEAAQCCETHPLCNGRKNRQEFGYVVLKFADVLHYATALKEGCKFFITNDTGIRSTDALEVILIKDLID